MASAAYCTEHNELILGDIKGKQVLVLAFTDGKYKLEKAFALPDTDVIGLGYNDFPSNLVLG